VPWDIRRVGVAIGRACEKVARFRASGVPSFLKFLNFLKQVFDQQSINLRQFRWRQFDPDVLLAGISGLQAGGPEQRRRTIANIGGHDQILYRLVQQNDASFPWVVVSCGSDLHVGLLLGSPQPQRYSTRNKPSGHGFLSSKETLMLRWLVRIGALFVAYKFGEEVGRAQARVDLRAPLDYERLPADRQQDDFGIEPF